MDGKHAINFIVFVVLARCNLGDAVSTADNILLYIALFLAVSHISSTYYISTLSI